MNLQLLCKINAVVIGINGFSALLMYNMWFNMAGIEATGPTIALAQSLGVAVVGTAIISWATASIAGDAITSYGRYAPDQVRKPKLITLYHLTQGYLPNQQPLYINIVISLILAASFFYYSRKTE